MYHCHIQIYLVGSQCDIWESMKEKTSLEHFTHTFLESEEPDEMLTARADAIFVNLQAGDTQKILRMLKAYKKKETELILLVRKDQVEDLTDSRLEAEDLWEMPMSEKEFGFRFHRWRRIYKLKRDLWQSDQFLMLV